MNKAETVGSFTPALLSTALTTSAPLQETFPTLALPSLANTYGRCCGRSCDGKASDGNVSVVEGEISEG